MNRLVEELLNDMAGEDYVPDQAEALVVIAFYVKQIADSLAEMRFKS